MRRPEIVVTAAQGYAGTSFIMRLARELGWDIGQPDDLWDADESEPGRKGLEWTPFRDVAWGIAEQMGCLPEPTKPWWPRIIPENVGLLSGHVQRALDSLDFPQVLKAQDFGFSRFLGFLEPKHVILCYRPLVKQAHSLRHENIFATRSINTPEAFDGLALALGLLFDSLEMNKIPYTIVHFPDMVDDQRYLWGKVGDVLTPGMTADQRAFAFHRCANPDWVRFR